jgi:hypothetical protein
MVKRGPCDRFSKDWNASSAVRIMEAISTNLRFLSDVSFSRRPKASGSSGRPFFMRSPLAFSITYRSASACRGSVVSRRIVLNCSKRRTAIAMLGVRSPCWIGLTK